MLSSAVRAVRAALRSGRNESGRTESGLESIRIPNYSFTYRSMSGEAVALVRGLVEEPR